VRNLYFRVAHFAMILLVCVEAAIGSTCPLTRLENELRLRGSGRANLMWQIDHSKCITSDDPRLKGR
jgi:hypothetical protein